MASKFQLSKTDSGKFHFVLKAANGEVILSSQTYADAPSARAGIESVKANAAVAANFDRRMSSADQPFFVLLATNKQIIGTSEMYTSTSGRDNGIASVMTNAPIAEVVES